MTQLFHPAEPLDAGAIRAYHALLGAIATHGDTVATRSPAAAIEAFSGVTRGALESLDRAGLVALADDTIVAVFPFVTDAPSVAHALGGDPNRNRLVAGVLDAFALPPLLGQRTRVVEPCPVCLATVAVVVDPNRVSRLTPRSAVAVRVPYDGTRQGRRNTARLVCSPDHAQVAIQTAGNPAAVIQSVQGLFKDAREAYALALN